MFETIVTWIKGLWSKIMIASQTLKNTFGVESKTSSVMADAIDLWAKMYANEAPWLSSSVKSLNLSVAIASEISRMATIEAVVEVEGGARAEYLQEQMAAVFDEIREQMEYGVAIGGLVMKPFVTKDGKMAVEYHKASEFIPVEFDSTGALISVIFVDKRKVNDRWYTKLEFHQMVGRSVVIRNAVFKSSSESDLGSQVPLTASIEEWADLLPEATIANVDKPLFAYFRNPVANSVDPNSKLGMSCYGRAVDLIKEADFQWSNFLWEFESGQRALYVDVLAFKRDANNNPILPNKRLYRTIDAGGQEDALFEDWSPTFRQADLLAGLDAILRRIEFTVGLAYGTLSNPQTIEKTATEIAAAKQRTYALIVDTQKAIRDAMEHLAYAIDVWTTLFNLAPAGPYEISFTFDDSTIVDKELQFTSDLRLVQSGIMSKVEFRMRNFGEDEEVARAKVAEATSEQPDPMSMFNGA